MRTIWLRLKNLISEWRSAAAELPAKAFRVLLPVFVVLAAFVVLLIGFSENDDNDKGFITAWNMLKSGFAQLSARGVTLVTDQQLADVLPKNVMPGFLYIEAPQLYTRERLVNDRFRQANWLSKELERTTEAGDADRFAIASRDEKRNEINRLMAQFGNGAKGPNGGAQSAGSPSDQKLALDQLKLLERRISYRAELRNELMDTQLDDGHDLDGNTLYRLNFDAVAMPWADARKNPGAAVFIVKARQSNGLGKSANASSGLDADLKQSLDDDLQLLRSWQREMQIFLTRVLRYRTENFKQSGTLPNPTDPKEDIAFDWLLRVKLIESFLDVLVDRVELVFPCEDACDEKTNAIKTVLDRFDRDGGDGDAGRRAYRRDLFAEWIGLSYRTNKKTPDIESPAIQASFRKSIRRAGNVNNLRWRESLGVQAYAPECLKAWEKQMKEKAVSLSRPEFCARSLPDPNNLQAIVRLISVVEAMRYRPQAKDKNLFQISFDKNGFSHGLTAFSLLMAKFDGIVPTREEIAAMVKEWQRADGKKKLSQNAEDSCAETAGDLFEFGKCNFLNASAGKAAEKMIASFIDARIKGELPSYGEIERPVGDFLDVKLTGCGFTRCRFEIRKKEAFSELEINNLKEEEREAVQAVVTDGDTAVERYEHSRCAIDVSKYYKGFPGEEPKLDPVEENELSNPKTKKEEEEEKKEEKKKTLAAFTEFYAACRLRAWLDERRNDLAVYGVSPRIRGVVTTQGASKRSELGAGGATDLIPGAELRVDRQREVQRSEASVTPLVIGFSQLSPDALSLAKARAETVFGWVVRSTQSPDGSWKAGHHRLAAVLSVPSWWKRLEFEVLACWSSPARARKFGRAIVKDPTAICPDPKTGAQALTRVNADGGGVGAKGGSSASAAKSQEVYTVKRTFRIQLPRRAEDVTARFNFDFIKTPYFETSWTERIGRTPISLEVGRKGRVVLPGERLWRGTVVTLGEQPADNIVVLPDMKGVIAEFDCVYPPAGSSDHVITFASLEAANAKVPPQTKPSARADVTVWTAEGRTPAGTHANLLPFVQRTQDEKPCFARD